MKLPAYPRTKPSGVEWLGDVPEHWEVTRFRFCVRASNAGEVIDRSYWYSGDKLLFSCQRESMISDFPDFPLRKRTTENDLLVTRNGTPYVHVPPANAIYSNVVQRCTLKDGPLRSFVALALETACERLRGDGYGVSIPSFSYEKWCDLSLPLPAPAEQQAIAAFLDRETGRVDRLVAKKRELIERLKEKRTALISRTVTRGLPPAAARAAGLPENPPLKPSGLDWLGDIPAHWQVKALTRVTFSIRNGTSVTQLEDASESAVPVTRIESISGGRINFDKFGQVEWTPSLERYRLKKGDILLSHINSLSMVGNCAIFDSDRPLYSGMNLLRIEPEPTVHAPWLWRVLSSDGIRKEISARAKPAINQASVTTTQIKALQLPVPPLPEQAAIAAYLDEETTKLDALVGKVEEAVERLQEYRTALITAAVTGKIDVRKEVAA